MLTKHIGFVASECLSGTCSVLRIARGTSKREVRDRPTAGWYVAAAERLWARDQRAAAHGYCSFALLVDPCVQLPQPIV